MDPLYAHATGRVRVSRDGLNGTVCSDMWAETEAVVVCRQLGYNAGHAFVYMDEVDIAHLPVLISNIKCNGTESSLQDCSTSLPMYYDCTHSVGVLCSSHHQVGNELD